MYLLDTNVISEIRKIKSGRAAPSVAAWESRVSSSDLWMSAISVLELEVGILRLQRKDEIQAALLRRWLQSRVLPSFAGRILPIDTAIAQYCARLHVPDPRSERDALIAATAFVHGLTIVTRNARDFAPMGVPLLNPWA